VRRLGAIAVTVAAFLGAGAGLSACGGPGSYSFSAVFASGQNLFPGSRVQVLGLGEGSVTSVTPQGKEVVVEMKLPDADPLPAKVTAALVAPELLGQRSVDLEPAYTGGPRLAPGSTIPESRTSVPVETNQILHEVTNYLKALQPVNVHNAVSNLAQDLNGQGQALGDLIDNAAGTIQLLAQKGNELGQLNGTLAHLTSVLDTRTTQIETLISDYDVVAGVVAQDRDQLDGAIAALSDATNQLAAIINPNVSGLKSDLATLTTVGRTIDRNLSSIDLGLSSSVALFAGAQRAYDPSQHWLALNNQSPPGTSTSVLADDLRDRLAGVCRRLTAHHSQGLTSQELSTLATCGNPASGYFDSVLGLVPAAAGGLPGQSTPATTQSAYEKGLDTIPGLSSEQRQQLGQVSLTSATTASELPPTPAEQVGPMAPPPPVEHLTVWSEVLAPFRDVGRLVADLW
jgi:phospholipid/cholesterol/gamma-HCH transport system substrate-binding protein